MQIFIQNPAFSKSRVVSNILFGTFYCLLTILLQQCCSFSVPGYKGKVTDHFDGEQFHNLDVDSSLERSFWDMLKWGFSGKKGEWADFTESEPGLLPPERVGKGELRVTFINHSTVLVQYDSLNIITDPVWSKTVSPVSFIGVSRRRPPGIRFSDLPPIDIVLISHNHYDHLDLSTLILLKEKFDPVFIAPLGNMQILSENNILNTIELDWWDKYEKYDITLVPAKHFSMRGMCDRNNTLWGGFVLNTQNGPVYFAGDTGFGNHFEQIYNKFGPMRFSMIPIGTFEPRWFMSFVHIAPEDAVKAHKILHSKRTMGIHLGTFSQGYDGDYDPVYYLQKALRKENIPIDDFIALPEGDGVRVR